MLKKIIIVLILSGQFFISFSQEKIKNVILMIPDGTSISLVSLSRYYEQWRTGNLEYNLAMDPYLCGLVRSTCSNAPIGDSAPTGSSYLTGQPAQRGNIAIYPVKTNQDLYEIDSSKAYQPLVTLLEYAKSMNMSTGIVVTCQFSHATPASCASHHYNRNAEEILAKQMIYNNIDVVLGGGQKYIEPYVDYLKSKGYEILYNKTSLLNNNSNKYWGVFDKSALPYFIDMDTTKIPTLAEMTQKAITTLSQNENGFFLMVEGSLIDWAMHIQDAKTAMIEFLEFNKAVDVAIQFAMIDKNTLVIIVPDHGTSGIAMGNNNSSSGYSKKSLAQFFEPFQIQTKSLEIDPILRKKLKKTSLIGFTTWGHTGEDLFLAVYHPQNRIPQGHLQNYEVHQYIAEQMGWNQKLEEKTKEYYVSHYQLYPKINGIINDNDKVSPTLTYEIDGKIITYFGNTNYAILDGIKVEFESIIVYIDKNKTFYLPNKKIM
jgi:alkaline phosphatase